ncbi:unnamed protein product [Symbiodinium sp. CCMP2592]|nr:unnamed protein product [Symbiodinium sp. CCMP2592]
MLACAFDGCRSLRPYAARPYAEPAQQFFSFKYGFCETHRLNCTSRRQLHHVVFPWTEFEHIPKQGARVADLYAGHPLSGMSPYKRGMLLQGLCKRVLTSTYPHLQLEEPVTGTCVNGRRRSTQQASWDWTLGGRKVECKSCRLSWVAHLNTWCVRFASVKFAEPDSRSHALFDDLYLVVDTPDSVHILKHDLRTGLTRHGAATSACGHSIKVIGSTGTSDWRSAWNIISHKLCEAKGSCEKVEKILLTDPRLLSAVCKEEEDSACRLYGCDPLSDLSPSARGIFLEQVGFEIDQKLNPTSTFIRQGERLPVDWIRGSVRVELKHARLVRMKAGLWRCCFSNIKCAADGLREANAFDELWLALYSPLGIDFFRSCGHLRYTSVGARGKALGNDLDLRRAPGQATEVGEALRTFHRQLEQAGCCFKASIRW